MFYIEYNHCYFKPAIFDGDYVVDADGNEYLVEENHAAIGYITTDNGQSWIIDFSELSEV